jgi:hypothetical protein
MATPVIQSDFHWIFRTYKSRLLRSSSSTSSQFLSLSSPFSSFFFFHLLLRPSPPCGFSAGPTGMVFLLDLRRCRQFPRSSQRIPNSLCIVPETFRRGFSFGGRVCYQRFLLFCPQSLVQAVQFPSVLIPICRTLFFTTSIWEGNSLEIIIWILFLCSRRVVYGS